MVPRLFGTHQILRLDTVAVQQACKLILGFPLDTLKSLLDQSNKSDKCTVQYFG